MKMTIKNIEYYPAFKEMVAEFINENTTYVLFTDLKTPENENGSTDSMKEIFYIQNDVEKFYEQLWDTVLEAMQGNKFSMFTNSIFLSFENEYGVYGICDMTNATVVC